MSERTPPAASPAALPPTVPRPVGVTASHPLGLRRTYASGRTIAALILREMSTRYGKSAGGYLWAILEPVGTILLLAVGFSLVIRAPSLGSNFLLFYASGYLPFHLYQQIALHVARAIGFSRPLLFYPAVTWFDAVLARFVLNALTGALVMTIALGLILAVQDTRSVISLPDILRATGLALVLGFGVGVMNCALMGLLPTWDVLWSILTKPLFLASGVLFIYEDMPRAVQNVLWYNPLLHITGILREGLYPTYAPGYVSALYVLGLSLALTVLGLVLLGRYHREILQQG